MMLSGDGREAVLGAGGGRTRSPPGAPCSSRWAGVIDYEVYLVWDDHLFAIMVAKLLRPDRFDDEKALRALRARGRGARAPRPSGAAARLRGVLDGPYPHVLVEHLEGPTLRRLIRRSGPLALRAGAAAGPQRGRGAALHARRGLRPPRHQARQHRDRPPAAADRLQPGAQLRARRADHAARSARAPTCRPSSAPRAWRARSARRPTSGGSEPRSTTRLRASSRSRAAAPTPAFRSRSASRSSWRTCARGR